MRSSCLAGHQSPRHRSRQILRTMDSLAFINQVKWTMPSARFGFEPEIRSIAPMFVPDWQSIQFTPSVLPLRQESPHESLEPFIVGGLE